MTQDIRASSLTEPVDVADYLFQRFVLNSYEEHPPLTAKTTGSIK